MVRLILHAKCHYQLIDILFLTWIVILGVFLLILKYLRMRMASFTKWKRMKGLMMLCGIPVDYVIKIREHLSFVIIMIARSMKHWKRMNGFSIVLNIFKLDYMLNLELVYGFGHLLIHITRSVKGSFNGILQSI